MQIAAIRAIPVNIPFVAPYRFSYGSIASLTKTLVEVTTDTGLVGWGEAADGDRSAAITALAPRLLGIDPLDLDTLERAAVPGYAYSPWSDMLCAKRSFGAIEMALWDIRGKLEGRPLSTLLGGAVRTEIPLTEYFPTAFPAPTMRVSQRRWRSRVSARGCSRSSTARSSKARSVSSPSRTSS